MRVALHLDCRCGHGRPEHRHYRPGSDCAGYGCDCRRFRRSLVLVVAVRTDVPVTIPAHPRAVSPVPPELEGQAPPAVAYVDLDGPRFRAVPPRSGQHDEAQPVVKPTD